MIRAIIAAMAAAIRSMARWCSKTGTWIQERVVTPGVEYFHEAVAGASAAVTGLVPDVVKGVAKLPGQAIRATGAVVEGGGKLAGASLSAVAAVPQALASGLAGGSRAMPAPAPQGRSGASEEVIDALQALRAGREAGDAMLDRSRVRAAAQAFGPVSAEAWLVHRYASADTYEREGVDLEELPPHLQDWLEGLNERQLQHLSQSAVLCQAAVSGQRTGLVGMPIPARPTKSVVDEFSSGPVGTVGQVLGDAYAFNARVAAAKGVRRDRQPH